MQIHRQGAKVAKGRGEFRSSDFIRLQMEEGLTARHQRRQGSEKNLCRWMEAKKAIPGLSKAVILFSTMIEKPWRSWRLGGSTHLQLMKLARKKQVLP